MTKMTDEQRKEVHRIKDEIEHALSDLEDMNLEPSLNARILGSIWEDIEVKLIAAEESVT